MDGKKSKIITAEGNVNECMLFSSKRNHTNLIKFIDELLEHESLSITLYDSYNNVHTYEFDISNLEGTLAEVQDYFE